MQSSLEERYFITALARGLDVLACFRVADKGLSNQQIAERCKLPKSTVTRFTYTLTTLGYLTQDGNGKYALGSATLRLGSTMLQGLDIRDMARPMMQELADFSATTVALAVRDRLSMIYVDVCRSAAALSLSLQVGSRLQLAASALGRAYLAKASEAERNDILTRSRDLDEMIHQSMQNGLARALRDQQEYGCATSFGEWQPDINGIAVSFMPIGGGQRMSINCGGPATSVTKEYLLEEVRPRLIEMARRLES
ncbi:MULTISPECIES: IclR family transcriptional regulator [unclassified Duganella]|jgi:DNA-binding IclR family transcriptional regulator|uniref:IclR family transcriptional regulator n=1 Tax=unclassified Duganella TaxID=2636909 RepID=UPI0008848E2F|nr:MULTISPECIES: IclR family transcriptional regulator [unclassified Duganella]SDF75100.1 transcriptional regulator, IclR family [Duganella sp. OV458]SDI54451.1 transcriptional regulator, IclR family [Duganella sp. OV510]